MARDAGATPGLVTHHFGSRAGLYRAVQEHVVELFRQALEAVPAKGSARAVAAARTASLEGMLAERPDEMTPEARLPESAVRSSP